MAAAKQVLRTVDDQVAGGYETCLYISTKVALIVQTNPILSYILFYEIDESMERKENGLKDTASGMSGSVTNAFSTGELQQRICAANRLKQSSDDEEEATTAVPYEEIQKYHDALNKPQVCYWCYSLACSSSELSSWFSPVG